MLGVKEDLDRVTVRDNVAIEVPLGSNLVAKEVRVGTSGLAVHLVV